MNVHCLSIKAILPIGSVGRGSHTPSLKIVQYRNIDSTNFFYDVLSHVECKFQSRIVGRLAFRFVPSFSIRYIRNYWMRDWTSHVSIHQSLATFHLDSSLRSRYIDRRPRRNYWMRDWTSRGSIHQSSATFHLDSSLRSRYTDCRALAITGSVTR